MEITIAIAFFIFGWIVGDRPKLRPGWAWISHDLGNTLTLEDEKCRDLISIHRVQFIYWHVGSEKFKSLWRAKRYALKVVAR